MKTAAILLVLMLAACGSSRNTGWNVKDENNVTWRLLECSRRIDCLARAADMCSGGYVDKYDGQNPRAMMIRCRADGWGALDTP